MNLTIKNEGYRERNGKKKPSVRPDFEMLTEKGRSMCEVF